LRSTLSLEVEETFAAGLWPVLLRTYVGARSSGCTLRQRRSFGASDSGMRNCAWGKYAVLWGRANWLQ
jgi:hypothetical protein